MPDCPTPTTGNPAEPSIAASSPLRAPAHILRTRGTPLSKCGSRPQRLALVGLTAFVGCWLAACGEAATLVDEGSGDELLDDEAALSAPFGVTTRTCGATPYPQSGANAYPTDFQQAVADDWTYVAWVWRLPGGAHMNHSVSVMKSRDLSTWYNLCGAVVPLPVTPASNTVIDPVPVNGGLLNGKLVLGFDASNRAIVTYHKHANTRLADGGTTVATQVFNARLEGSAIRIYQMTRWQTLDGFAGGGSLPARSTAVAFSGVRPLLDGGLVQSFTRSAADTERCAAIESLDGGSCWAFPRTGTWLLDLSATSMAIRQPLSSVSSAALPPIDPYEKSAPKALNPGPAENAPLSNLPGAAAWQVRTKLSTAESRWVTLRADFDGNTVNDRGVFDRYNSRFFIDDGTVTQSFQFGARNGLFWPLAGDWNADGRATIGVHRLATQTSWLRNSLTGGVADAVVVGPAASLAGRQDSPLLWHSSSPATRFALRWEALPTNNDCPYTCQGIPLQVVNGTCNRVGACEDATRMSSNLYVYAYDDASATWSRSFIDKAWGGANVGFELVTFKNLQFALYFGSDRNMRVASRVRSSGVWAPWVISVLDSRFNGWDSHNYLTAFVDANHRLHVAGNMHASRLEYFVSPASGTEPRFTRGVMTGFNEALTTYPRFFRSPTGQLLFMYRSGYSGGGDTYLNRYDERTGRWSPFHVGSNGLGWPTPFLKGR